MPGASLALFADLGACHVQKSSVTICVLPAPSGWRATGLRRRCKPCHLISIHALRVEGDQVIVVKAPRVEPFLSTPSGWRATAMQRINAWHNCLFLSTPSGWRATSGGWRIPVAGSNFYPRPPSGGRHEFSDGTFANLIVISIHALRVEGDAREQDKGGARRISIHALRVEGDAEAVQPF